MGKQTPPKPQRMELAPRTSGQPQDGAPGTERCSCKAARASREPQRKLGSGRGADAEPGRSTSVEGESRELKPRGRSAVSWTERIPPARPAHRPGAAERGAERPLRWGAVALGPAALATCSQQPQGRVFSQGQESAAMAEATEPDRGAQEPLEGPALLAERPGEAGAADPEAQGEEASEDPTGTPGGEGVGAAATAALKEGEDTGPDGGHGSELEPSSDSESGGETPGASGAQGEAEAREGAREGEGESAPRGGEEASGAEQVRPGCDSQSGALEQTQGEPGEPAVPKEEEEAERGPEEPGSSAPGASEDSDGPRGACMEAEGLPGGAPGAEGEPQDQADRSPQPQVESTEAAVAESGGCSRGELAGELQGAEVGAVEEAGALGIQESEEAAPGDPRADADEGGDQEGPQEKVEDPAEEKRERSPDGTGEEGPPDGSVAGETGAMELSNHLAEEGSAEGADETVGVNGRGDDGEASEEGVPGQDHDITLFVKVNLTLPNL